jgi:hypothetical protein
MMRALDDADDCAAVRHPAFSLAAFAVSPYTLRACRARGGYRASATKRAVLRAARARL